MPELIATTRMGWSSMQDNNDGEPEFGCLGLVVKGPAATVVMGGLVLLIIYLIGRCGG